MAKLAPAIIAIILFLGGIFIVAKVLLGRPTASVPNFQNCPTSNEIALTAEVKSYIDHELYSPGTFDPMTASVADVTRLMESIRQVENKIEDLSASKVKVSGFADLLSRYLNNLKDFDSRRQERLDKDRLEIFPDVLFAAVKKCAPMRAPTRRFDFNGPQGDEPKPPPTPAPSGTPETSPSVTPPPQ